MKEKGRFPVRVVVEKQEGHCAAGHKVGDSWMIDDGLTPAGLCTAAFAAMYPRVALLEFGGAQPWRKPLNTCRAACPDGPNPVWFQLTRMEEGEGKE
jgi:uncharacterized repeat protein (TIGR04076 family)